ncbi:ABC-type protease/lipase transport system, ATPase and permease components [Serratia quinivorans]|nr:ABC-type protease/lipase transport system, ATPase and permease components [Serratia quinivorans]
MSLLTLQQDVAILFYATLGKKADDKALTYFAKQLEKGAYTQSELATKFILSEDGQHRYDDLSTSQKVQYIYQNTNGIPPDATTLNQLTAQVDAGTPLGNLITALIAGTQNYVGNEAALLGQQQHLENIINTTLYPSQIEQPSQVDAAADVQGMYYLLGSLVNSGAIDYWSGILDSGKKTAVEMANYFVSLKGYISSLNNEDFVKKIFSHAFGTTANNADLQKYVSGLKSQSETRGDVMMRMMDDIRNDTSHDVARQNFAGATHVYAPGEIPAAKYAEVVMSLYLTVAGVSADAAAMDSFSRLLAGGKTQDQLLNTLAKTHLFSNADNYQSIYQKLYGSALDSATAQAILLKAGNDKITATSLIIEAFRNGEYPLDNNEKPNPIRVADYQTKIAHSLGYKTSAELSIANDGTLTGSVNSGGDHSLSQAELLVLTQVYLNINTPSAVNFTHSPYLQEVVLQGDMPTNDVTLNSLKNKSFALRINLDDSTWFKTAEKIAFGTEKDSVFVTDKYDISNARLNIDFADGGAGLLWNGNGVNQGANSVSTTFTAQNQFDASGALSANFILKDILLTTGEDGGISGQIYTNINQFLYFPTLDLAGYRGTGNIYLDGELVATEGTHVFDYGVINQTASIYNGSYANVDYLRQADHAQKSPDGTSWTGVDGFVLSGYADNVHVINIHMDKLPQLSVTGNAGAQSKLHLELASYKPAASEFWGVNIGNAALDHVDAGTLSFTSHFTGQQPQEMLRIYSSGSKLNTLALTGADSHIDTLYLSGVTKLEATVKAEFSDSLKNIIIEPVSDPFGEGIPRIEVVLTMEKGGTGGGTFYTLLSSLNSHTAYDGIISALAGDQINIQYTNSQTLNLKGNTTLNNLVTGNEHAHDSKINFEQSTVDNMVTINTLTPTDTITAGSPSQQWVFNNNNVGNIKVYGSVTKESEINTLFNSLSVDGESTAQDIFSQALAKIAPDGSVLQDVGVVKFGTDAYIVIDNNHNQKLDAQDIIFSLGNKDVYDIAANLHYQAPNVVVNGTSQYSAESI